MSEALIRQLLSAREHWIDVAEGKALKIRRPLEAEMQTMFRRVEGKPAFRVEFEDVLRFATDWRGFTEADLLGDAVGSSDPAPFDREVVRIAIGDNLEWLQSAINGLSDLIIERMTARATARGNSFATSTQQAAPKVAEDTSH